MLNEGTHSYATMSKWYRELFNEYPPEQPFFLLKLKIEYKLLKRGYDNANVDLTPTIRNNYEASQKFNVDKFTESMQSIIRSVLAMPTKVEAGNNRIKKIVKETVTTSKQGKVAKETVAQTYNRLFEQNVTKKLNDVELAAELCKAHPDKKKYTPADVNAARNMYNKNKPKVLSVRIEAGPVKVKEVKKVTLKVAKRK